MSKIAFVFSGQGAQKAGMGRSFYDNAEEVKTLYDAAENIRPGTIAQSFDGSDAELCQTVNTQPCLYLCDLAAAVTLNSLGVKADAAAGFSLGEIPALAFSGAYSRLDGFVHAIRRGEFMAKAAEANPASMAAILKLSDEAVIEICDSVGAWPVNFNCPGQVSAAFTSD
nr:ACP S-malonyltransferase [Clostridia bacterium]